jgi:hypothetical protein
MGTTMVKDPEYHEYSDYELKTANRVFINHVKSIHTPLSHGIALREQMINELNAGKIPTSYRYKWIRSSSDQMLKLLGQFVRDFNQEHPEDCASTLDIEDITAYVLNILKTRHGTK